VRDVPSQQRAAHVLRTRHGATLGPRREVAHVAAYAATCAARRR
jgi:hypothetical protein